jgi:ribosomal protein S18 acetylase RimI-like enzyme
MEPVRATIADIERLGVFFREAWREAGPGGLGFAGATQETINEIASAEFLRKRLANPNVQFYIICEGEKVLGLAATRRIDAVSVELSGMVVLESATGRRLGTILAKKVLADMRQAGFRKVVVKTEAVNQRAIQFYNKMGLREVGRGCEQVEENRVDVVILEKALQ